MRGLKDKTFLVAGGAAGIGAATAKRLASESACVAVGDFNIAGATAAAEQITRSDGRAIAVEFRPCQYLSHLQRSAAAPAVAVC